MLKKIISILFLIALVSTTVFAHTATIQMNGESKYKALRLTPEIYNTANADLSDILIKDSDGENVPYFINTGFEKIYEDKTSHPLRLINSYTKDESFYFDYTIENKPKSDVEATSIELFTDTDSFAKSIELYGSHDNINWEFIQNDKIYNIDGKSKLFVEFSAPQKYTHYRFELVNNLERISFSSAKLVHNAETHEKGYFIESISPNFTVEEKGKETLIKISGLKNLRLCDVEIHSNSTFKRNARAPFAGTKEIYNLSLNEITYTDMVIPLHQIISEEETYTITISNNDDKPVDISGITVRYYADEVVFESDSTKVYMLDFGADDTKTAPVYDIVRYKDEILKGTIDRVSIGTANYDTKPQPLQRDYSFIFNIVVVAVAVLLGILILLRLKNK